MRQDWLLGVAAKRIQERLPGRSEHALRRHAIEAMGLEPRRVYSTVDGKQYKFNVYVSARMKKAIGRRAIERGQPESAYIRMLIRRDLGYDA